MIEDTMLIDLNIDKSNWLPVKFGDVVREVRESTANPEADGLHRIVGLEHIEPENIHLNKWGELADSITFSRIFRKGQMLFGKRRSYLKKAALAAFDGICSGDIIVMEAKEDILPGILPFLICNDKFFEHAVKTSAGSLSPRTKFKDLAEYEFLLPPLEQQGELAELLWAGDEMIEEKKNLYNDILTVRKTAFHDRFKNEIEVRMLNKLPVENLNGLWKSDELDVLPVYVIRSTEIDEFGEINLSKIEALPVLVKQFKKRKLLPNDIVIERSGGGPTQPVGRVCFFKISEGDYSFSNFTSVIRVTDTQVLNPKFLFFYLLYFYEINGTNKLQKQTTGIRNLDFDRYQMTKVPFPSISRQNEIVDRFDQIDSIRKKTLENIDFTKQLQKSIIDQIF
jgi:type I restriction enzyme S subunit